MIQFDQQSGFVAGTLVHTDKGLVPIQQIKVGDMVLSRPEHEPDAPNQYKRVLNLIKSTSIQKISYVAYFFMEDDDANKSDGFRYVFCTENHHFYINKLGDTNCSSPVIRFDWRAAEMLGGMQSYIEGVETLLQDKVYGGIAPLDHNESRTLIKRSNYFAQVTTDDDRSGPLIDFRDGRPVAIGGVGISFSDVKYLSSEQEQIIYPDGDPNVQVVNSLISSDFWDDYEDYVYNLEIENYHTYFVEKIGLWVHGASTNIS